ncbi:MAG TPA: transporter [Candidatus Dorea merdavium]|nr:transporter [Candidatus Dorea merdavium]
MKQIFLTAGTLLLFALIILFPGVILEGAQAGLLLWFNTVLPALLPFLILSNLLLGSPAIQGLARFTGRFLRPLFGVSDYGSYVMLTGFLCGYPMGSKTAADLTRAGRISLEEGQYLLSFCNNTSPMFVLGFVAIQCLQAPALAPLSLLLLWIPPLLLSFLFRPRKSRRHPKECTVALRSSNFAKNQTVPGEIPGGIDNAILDGFTAITRIGGYIILFSILIQLLGLLPFRGFPPFQVLLSSLEVTNGAALIGNLPLSFQTRFSLCMGMVSFGGWCSVAQTRSMIQGSGLSIFPYIIQKLATAMVTSLLSFLMLSFCLSKT